ncbi:hypothetical protein GCK72_019609 [Caenorhabditis remanei]|uniref:Uncharacterized protein n=1 Tax=Caenorhabditis remanei TaxID=31234 RepID=A0A6A5GEF4_CAERE|nr:hypothetical protein GCK72_019609 [Caenorhabditis remanei]KAF1753053.1 hypothetical protein GCK72_019609 [Caenorhabditis remanei]
MSRDLLKSTMYIEQIASKSEDTWTSNEQEQVEKLLKNPKNSPKEEPKAKKQKLADRLDEEIETGIRLLLEFVGFEDISETTLLKLKNVYYQRLITSSRQLSAAERRKKDGLEIPYKSPLEWTLKLNGVQRVLEIKEWYDVIYWRRYRELKETFGEKVIKSE